MCGIQCPYCNSFVAVNDDCYKEQYPSFDKQCDISTTFGGNVLYGDSTVKLSFLKCPNCGKYSIDAHGVGAGVRDIHMSSRPMSCTIHYADYIPCEIRSDYEEACSIVTLSPKASAALARRCLQGIIRDFWGIHKNSLYEEIYELHGKIPADLWAAIDALMQLGNIGAHMKKNTNVIVDIDADEAEKLIRLIELLIKEWYINREERKNLFGDIIKLNDDIQNTEKSEG